MFNPSPFLFLGSVVLFWALALWWRHAEGNQSPRLYSPPWEQPRGR